MQTKDGKKVTLATIKSFIAREQKINNLYISKKSNFDGMVDCVMPTDDQSFTPTLKAEDNIKYNLGVYGAWFVGNSRDYFTPYADDNFIGYEIYNCCGSFILAMKRQPN